MVVRVVVSFDESMSVRVSWDGDETFCCSRLVGVGSVRIAFVAASVRVLVDCVVGVIVPEAGE